MAGITHAKVSIIADDPNYDIQPGHWNAEHKFAGLTANGFMVGDGADGLTAQTLAETKTLLVVLTKYLRATVSNPQAVYAQRAQIPIMLTPYAITITSIKINTGQTAQEMAGDLKFADDIVAGSFANATVIDVCDTTSGMFTATAGFDDATIPSGKEIYFQMDASPNAAIKDLKLEIQYTVDV